MRELDRTDLKILDFLQKDGRRVIPIYCEMADTIPDMWGKTTRQSGRKDMKQD